ncbi:MAG: geranylgeranyl reductase family protein [Acidimicrobiia bacterium]
MPSPSVLVVGGGPAGAAAALWLARDGHDVLMVEKKSFPREKTCGDGLTPRAILQLQEMGFDFDVPEFHRISGLRSYAGDDLMMEMNWPDHSRFPDWGGVIRRRDLDAQVARLTEKEGVRVLEETTATPVIEDGLLASVLLERNGSTEKVAPQVTVIADGSHNRFGRELGTTRRRDYPMGMATRAYYSSPFSGDGFLESQLDLRDASGATIPGYGWIFPMGDGTVNLGVGLLSTFKRWKRVNGAQMMNAYVAATPGHWELTEDSRLTKPMAGKLTMSFSKEPLVGANWITVGDAAGAINPWNGEGISYAYETGRIAAHYIGEALALGDLSILHRYSRRLDDEYGLYYRMARLFVRAITHPPLMRSLAHTGLRNRPLMEWTLKVMANLLDEDEKGIGERAYAALGALVRALPVP